MKAYLLTIFSRAFLAFSGFLVFILTAHLYGPEGRGVIGYATSFFAILGSFFSFNLGRGFLAETLQHEEKKKSLIGDFLVLNFLFAILVSIVGFLYLTHSETALEMLTMKQIVLFSFTGLFYIWSANGNYFYSSFFKTSLQDVVILSVRIILIACLALLILFKNSHLNHFIFIYCLTLFLGVLVENFLLIKSSDAKLRLHVNIRSQLEIIKKSIVHHIDYLAFHTYPLILTVLSASYLDKSDVGKVNFTFQIINLIFLFSVTANIRVSAYVAHSGSIANLEKYKKLGVFTVLISIISVFIIYFGLQVAFNFGFLSQFEGVQNLFIIAALSIPGYILYQFLGPIWIELKKQKLTAVLHFSNFIIGLIVAPIFITRFQISGVLISYSFFGVGVFLLQIFLIFRFLFKSSLMGNIK